MANPNALFGTIAGIDRAGERGITVELTGGGSVRFERGDRRAEAYAAILEDLQQRKMPAYIETDAAGNVALIRLPKIVRVETITTAAGGELSVTFERSHARHVAKPDSAEANALRAARKDQWLAVTVNDRFEIIDVRPFEPPFELPRYEPPPLRWWHRWWWPWNWNWFDCISFARAQQLFNLVAATTCNPTTVPPPCIPFLFPDDGCWGRAHEMCRLMIAAGAWPRKVWIYGTLHTPTRNNPACFVNWGWHVAPTLCVRRFWWWPFFFRQAMVIDPSLFTTPVSRATWKSVQGDPAAIFVDTSADVFSRWSGDQPDPGYVQTNQVLADYRTALQLRSLGPSGPPPYAGCP